VGTIRQLHFFDWVRVQQVHGPSLRLEPELGGWPLYDRGISCLKAARTLFRTEPTGVFAFAAAGDPRGCSGVEEMLCGLLRFPGERLATCVCSSQLATFADCVRSGRDPESSGPEGLADVRVIRALGRSAKTGRCVRLAPDEPPARPVPGRAQERPAAESPELLGARAPSGR